MSDRCSRLWRIWWSAEHRHLDAETCEHAWQRWEACWQAELAGIEGEACC
jgi:hypothetical protein